MRIALDATSVVFLFLEMAVCKTMCISQNHISEKTCFEKAPVTSIVNLVILQVSLAALGCRVMAKVSFEGIRTQASC